MEEPCLVDRYRHYKVGTRTIKRWLAGKARLCKSPPSKSTSRSGITNILIQRATRIAECRNPRIDIPMEVLEVLQDVIAGRQHCADFYSAILAKGHGDAIALAELAEKNRKHRHFIKTLQRVFEILRSEQKSRLPKRKRKMPARPTNTNDLTNLYEHLELIDTSSPDVQQSQQDHSTEQPMEEQGTHPRDFDPEDEEDDSDLLMEMYCRLQDFSEMRAFLRCAWSKHSRGEISFMVATELTSCATAIQYEIDSEFFAAHPDGGDMPTIMKLLGMDGPASHSASEPPRPAPYDGAEASPSLAHTTTDLDCTDVYVALEYYKKAYHEGKKPELCNLSAGAARLVELGTSLRAWVEGENIDLKKMVGEHQFGGRAPDFGTFELLRMLLPKEKTSLRALMLTQIYLDIADALDGHLERGMTEAGAVIEQVTDSIQSLEKYTSFVVATQDRNELDRYLKLLRFVKEWHIFGEKNGIPGWYLAGLDGKPVDPASRIFVPTAILRNLPLLLGSRADYVLRYTGFWGLKMCAGFEGLALSCGWLQRAGLTTGCVKKPWEDLKFFVDRQNELGTFVMQSDKNNLENIENQFSLVLGLTLGQVRNKTAFQTQSLLTLAKHHDLPKTKPRAPSVLDEKRRQHNCLERDLGVRLSAIRIFYELVKHRASSPTGIRSAQIASQWKETKHLAPVQLLEVALETLIDDEPHVRFDYPVFAGRCIKLVHKIQDVFWIKDEHGVDLFDNTDSIMTPSFLGIHTFIWQAGQATRSRVPLHKTPLFQVCKFLEEIAEEGGSCVIVRPREKE